MTSAWLYSMGFVVTFAPLFAKLAAEYSWATFVSVDVDENQTVATEQRCVTADRASDRSNARCRGVMLDLPVCHRVTSMPTFKMIRGGKVVDEMNGADENALKEKIQGLAGKADRWASAGSARQI